jgi:microcin C transport system substrate-binding protein
MLFQRICTLGMLLLAGFYAQADEIHVANTFAILGAPKYAGDFQHFDYVNPQAPKGGSITLSALGTFDNFNRFASRGNAVVRSDTLYDSMFITSNDEVGSYYPLIALSARYDSQFKWVEVTLNPNARFQDGQPITAADVEFSFDKFMTEGVAQFRVVYRGITVKALDAHTVRMEFPHPDKDQMLGLLSLPILPQHFWKQHKFNEPLTTPPVGSGPYRITDYRMGQYVVYSRIKDYWAADLPVNRGRFNFDTIRYDYYLDDSIALAAFKSGAFDFRSESSPKQWVTQYQGNNFTRHYIVRKDEENLAAQDTRWLAFNIQRPIFEDRRVRQAISLAFDFEWMNRALYYSGYQRSRSLFQNTPYEAKQLPDADELKWLMPYKGQIPDEVFNQVYQPPVSDASGYDRNNLLQADSLLKQAGWIIKDQKRVNATTGIPLVFELLLPSSANSQYVLPFQHNLQRLGIQLSIREIDNSQFTNRVRHRDYDMIPTVYNAQPYPSSDLRILWHSSYLNSSYNRPGVNNPVIDKLTEEISNHQGQQAELLTLGRVLDRILTWNMYMIPMWYSNHDRYAYWNKFSMPAIRATYSLELDSWWFDNAKAAQLPAQRQ